MRALSPEAEAVVAALREPGWDGWRWAAHFDATFPVDAALGELARAGIISIGPPAAETERSPSGLVDRGAG